MYETSIYNSDYSFSNTCFYSICGSLILTNLAFHLNPYKAMLRY